MKRGELSLEKNMEYELFYSDADFFDDDSVDGSCFK